MSLAVNALALDLEEKIPDRESDREAIASSVGTNGVGDDADAPCSWSVLPAYTVELDVALSPCLRFDSKTLLVTGRSGRESITLATREPTSMA